MILFYFALIQYCSFNKTVQLYLQCNEVAVINEQKTRQCCFLQKEEILYKKPGDQILYHLINATVTCKKGWSGSNCDACALRWSGANCDACALGWAGQNCDACAPGWTGDDCDTCADGWLPPTCDQICDGFGCCNHSNCQGCIQDGKWEGAVGAWSGEVHLTFRGEACSDLVPGNFTRVTSTYT